MATIPHTMRAVTYSGERGECIGLGQEPVPEPGEGEVLIRVAAAGVNRPDILQRRGLYPPPKDASPRLGLEVAGDVVACGPGVVWWRVGDRVCALANGGGYADYALAPEGQVLQVPDSLTDEQAAALPETFFTVWHNVFQRGGLQKGEILLLHGGTSGIGTTAIQLARAFGARVFATAGNDAKCHAIRQLGAERAINYQAEDFVSIVKEAGGADVVLDMVGGDYIPRNIKACAPDGRIVSIAFLGGSEVTVNFAPVMLKRLTLTGSTLRAQSASAKAGIAAELRHNVWPLIERSEVRPVMARSFPLAAVEQAHELMESSAHIGKIVLQTQ